MKKRNQVALFFSLLILFIVGYGVPANANPFGETEYAGLPIIIITSPLDNSTISTDNTSLNISVEKPTVWLTRDADTRSILKSISYQLDGKLYGPIIANSYLESPFNYSTDLENLTVGRHSLKVFAEANGWIIENHGVWHREIFVSASSGTIYFTVEKNVPAVIVAPIVNSSIADVPLDFNINCTASRIVYSLDSQENQSIAGNTTLTGLPNGLHNVTVYAWDVDGNMGVSDTVFFDVEVPAPFPTFTVTTVSVASVAVVCVALFYCFRWRKR
jgi:hypothetical protein